MQRQEIVIEIKADGRVEFRIEGIKGSSCESIAALLAQVGQVESSERTAEYDAREPDTLEQINLTSG